MQLFMEGGERWDRSICHHYCNLISCLNYGKFEYPRTSLGLLTLQKDFEFKILSGIASLPLMFWNINMIWELVKIALKKVA